MRPQLRVARRTVLPVPRLVERQAGDPGGRWQALQQVALAEQQGDAAVLDHVAEALLRIFRVQRYVGAAGPSTASRLTIISSPRSTAIPTSTSGPTPSSIRRWARRLAWALSSP